MKNRIFMTIPKLLVDTRRMLVDAHKVQKCKVWTLGFQTHNFACNLGKNSLNYSNLNLHAFLHFLKNAKFFEENMQNSWKFAEIYQFWIFKISASFDANYMINCAFESSRSIPCNFALCEHLRASREHLRAFFIHNASNIWKKSDFL